MLNHRMSGIGSKLKRSSCPAGAGKPRLGHPGTCPVGFECLQRSRPYNLSEQAVPE